MEYLIIFLIVAIILILLLKKGTSAETKATPAETKADRDIPNYLLEKAEDLFFNVLVQSWPISKEDDPTYVSVTADKSFLQELARFQVAARMPLPVNDEATGLIFELTDAAAYAMKKAGGDRYAQIFFATGVTQSMLQNFGMAAFAKPTLLEDTILERFVNLAIQRAKEGR